ncbi:hypothetical protein N7451_006351 [Penicillium sp. IBT 35674x]|nr:hypothetical protein N7451_006351 [Penicillium sp. IBT 35674x]
MGWAIFCAICGGPFSSEVDIDPENTDECYRDRVLRDSNLEWLDDLCALGINPDALGNDKSFLTGIGDAHDYGVVEVDMGEDPNFPVQNNAPMIAYHDHAGIRDSHEPHVFPFHPTCYEDILQRCIRQGDSKQIRRDVLFDVFEGLNGGQYVRLQLIYGEPEPPAEQVWYSNKGQEVLVANPVEIPQLDAEFDIIMKSQAKNAGQDQNSQGKDVFNRLPLELRYDVFKLLPAGSILALKAASWVMHTTTLPREFWRHRLRSEMPWLWEIHDIDVFESQELENKASKLLLDIPVKSQYTSKNDDYILGLANRRRIWGVCEQIRSRYFEKLKDISNADS